MFNLYAPMSNCDGVSRRAFLRVGSLSLFGLTLPKLLEARALAPGVGGLATAGAAAAAHKPVNCILLWTEGGMSNVDTFDMKPDAPVEYRGEFRPIRSNV